MNFGSAPRTLLRAAAVALVASSAGACSSVPSWMNPFGDEEPQVADDAAVAPADGTTPDLASVPDRPVQTSTPDSQKQVVASLAADRSRANYSSDALRGDAAVPAAPPGPPVPVDTSSSSDSAVADTTPTSAEAGPTTDAAAAAGDTTSDNSMPAPVASAAVPAASASPAVSSPTPAVGSAPAVGSTYPRGEPAVPEAVADTQPAVGSTSRRMASTSTTPVYSSDGGRPAVPEGSYSRAMPGGGPVVAPADAALGFQASSAPPLDASVAQFVAPSILNRYRQTAGQANVVVASAAVPGSASTSRRTRGVAMGGPDQMTGSVVANFDSINSPTTATPAVYSGASGMPPASVVFFPGDTTILNAAAKAQVRAAVEAYRAKGSAGFIRVVGHSSSRTGNMPLERHLVVIFEKSQQRASSVAQELIRDGVPAERVLVEAVGDSEPVYYESMPKGEDGNRRAEIFLQS